MNAFHTVRIAWAVGLAPFFAFWAFPVYSQSTSTVTNNAAPTVNAASNTSGGTNINQQLNNIYDTSFGFGPGIVCRTPQIILNATYGKNLSGLDIFDSPGGNAQNSNNYAGTVGIAVPIFSSVIADCQRYAAQIAKDREISSELSLIRACAQLERDKIAIDPQRYPLLAKCLTPADELTRPFSKPPSSNGIPAPSSRRP